MTHSLDKIRNIGIMSHIDAGKTTTTERILFYTKKIHRMGEVHNGVATMDWMEQERERGITITSAATTCHWRDCRINIIDTPGHIDFTAEVERSLRVLDGAIALFCGVGGVEPQSETVWRQADKYNVPRLAFVNKMDRVGADYHNVIRMMKSRLKANPVPLQIPMGEGELFTGLIDLIKMRAVIYNESSLGTEWEEIDIPKSLKAKAEEYRTKLFEAISDVDDSIMEKYLDGEDIPIEDIKSAIRKAVLEVKFIPVLCGSAFKNKGIQRLLDALVDYLPSPTDKGAVVGEHPKTGQQLVRKPGAEQPFSALAFKVMTDPFVGRLTFFRIYSGTVKVGTQILNTNTGNRERLNRILLMFANKREEISELTAGNIAAAVGLKNTSTGDTLCDPKHAITLENVQFPDPVIQVAIEPKSKNDEEKLSIALKKLAEEDPTFKIKTNEETGQLIISGMGELHLEILTDRMVKEFGVHANIGKPHVTYRETITEAATGRGKFVKQTGGRGQYGDVKLTLEPSEKGKGFLFENKIVGGAIPKQFIDPVIQGVRETLKNGVLAGYPMIDVKVTLIDGSYHDVDSSEIAFKVAGSMALKEAIKNAGPVLLEPVSDLEVIVPEEYTGDIIGNITSRRGKILGLNPRPDAQVISAIVPLRDMFGYATELRSLSQGRAVYSMEFKSYLPMPQDLATKLIENFSGVYSFA